MRWWRCLLRPSYMGVILQDVLGIPSDLSRSHFNVVSITVMKYSIPTVIQHDHVTPTFSYLTDCGELILPWFCHSRVIHPTSGSIYTPTAQACFSKLFLPIIHNTKEAFFSAFIEALEFRSAGYCIATVALSHCIISILLSFHGCRLSDCVFSAFVVKGTTTADVVIHVPLYLHCETMKDDRECNGSEAR